MRREGRFSTLKVIKMVVLATKQREGLPREQGMSETTKGIATTCTGAKLVPQLPQPS